MRRVFVISVVLVGSAALASAASAEWWSQSAYEDELAFVVGVQTRSMERDIEGGDVKSGEFESDEDYLRIGLGFGGPGGGQGGLVYLDAGQADASTTLRMDKFAAREIETYELDTTEYFAFGLRFLAPVGAGAADTGEGWMLGVALEFAFWVSADVESVEWQGVEATNVDGEVSATEFQLDLLGGYSLLGGNIRPYAGVRLSGMNMDVDELTYTVPGNTFRVDGSTSADDMAGVVGGLEVSLPNDRVALSVEASAGDADTIVGGIELRF
jgi:hypothetical protein